eukprot:CAMPEP_0119517752 /NCGR_PEP_ID=MMETSP1344-20130328/34542_1 /TAXON_ID=236787 /ORGANISM="Florenciella parvula, Strain CCMP2471" /LENGTH=355 /DNA_ID=CAMNT_0007555371 /DNA_START=68 /DNA_END=1131 /DNA_ORIENTATION=-
MSRSALARDEKRQAHQAMLNMQAKQEQMARKQEQIPNPALGQWGQEMSAPPPGGALGAPQMPPPMGYAPPGGGYGGGYAAGRPPGFGASLPNFANVQPLGAGIVPDPRAGLTYGPPGGGGGGGGGQRGGNRNMKEGDWICGACGNNNFAWREVCNNKKCGADKEGASMVVGPDGEPEAQEVPAAVMGGGEFVPRKPKFEQSKAPERMQDPYAPGGAYYKGGGQQGGQQQEQQEQQQQQQQQQQQPAQGAYDQQAQYYQQYYQYQQYQQYQQQPMAAAAPAAVPAAASDGWQEYKTAQGQSYYYNAATGVTSWTKPETAATAAPTAVAAAPVTNDGSFMDQMKTMMGGQTGGEAGA